MIFSLRLLTAWCLVIFGLSAEAARKPCAPLLVRIGLGLENSQDFVLPETASYWIQSASRTEFDSPESRRRSFLSTYRSARLAGLTEDERSAFWSAEYHLGQMSFVGVPTDPRLNAALAHPGMKTSVLQIVPEIHDIESKLLDLEHRGRIARPRNLPFAKLADRFREAAVRGEWAFLHALPAEFVKSEIARIAAIPKMPRSDRAFAIGLLRASSRSYARYAARQTGWFGLGRELDWPIVSRDARALEDQNRRAVVALAKTWSLVDAEVAAALANPKWRSSLAKGRAEAVPPEVTAPKAWVRARRLEALEREWREVHGWTESERRERAFIVEQFGFSPRMTARLQTAIRTGALDFEKYRRVRANKQRLKGDWILE